MVGEVTSSLITCHNFCNEIHTSLHTLPSKYIHSNLCFSDRCLGTHCAQTLLRQLITKLLADYMMSNAFVYQNYRTNFICDQLDVKTKKIWSNDIILCTYHSSCNKFLQNTHLLHRIS